MSRCLLLSLAMFTVAGCLQSDAHRLAYLCPDTVAVAKAAGYDYENLVSRALSRDKQALRTLFWLSAHAGFDGASAEGDAGVLGALLKHLGDQHFSECLKEEPQDIREAVRGDIDYEMGYAYEPLEIREFRTEFPLTYATCFTVAERVQCFVDACRREVHNWQPDCEAGDLGLDAVPELLKLMTDERKVWVRIGPPQGGPESTGIDVRYLYADDEGPRNSVAEFALLCIYRIREPQSGTTEDFAKVWDPIMTEFTDYDGKVSVKTIREINTWYDGARAKETH
jgi:hypothetical protein